MPVIYSKPVTKTNVEVQLAVPNDSFGRIAVPSGEHSVEFEAIDGNGRAWPFHLCTLTRGTSFKTVLSDSGGWLTFVHNEGLGKGDKVIFYGETNEAKELKFRIQLQRNQSFS